MANWKDYDGAIVGAIAGLLIAFPSIATTIYNWVASIIPAGWLVLGTYSLPVYLVALGALIGYLVDRS